VQQHEEDEQQTVENVNEPDPEDQLCEDETENHETGQASACVHPRRVDVNRWARRHAATLERELEDGERLSAARIVSLAASGKVGEETSTLRRRAVRRRSPVLPVLRPIFVIAITNQRILFWDVTRALAAPREMSGEIARDDVKAVRPVGRLGSRRVAVVLSTGDVAVLRAEQGYRLRDLVTAFEKDEPETG
jgi:hypothetical protein